MKTSETYAAQIEKIKERVEDITFVEVSWLFKKKAVVYGSNDYFNYIRIVHDYESGKVLSEEYENIKKIHIHHAFA